MGRPPKSAEFIDLPAWRNSARQAVDISHRSPLAEPALVATIPLAADRRGYVTLVYSSHDAEHNNAVALKAYLAGKIGGRGRTHRAA